MANHKSALKRARQSKVRRARNRINKTKVNNAVKKTRALIGGEPAALEEALRNAVGAIHRAKTKGTLHKRTASRRISRLSRQVHLSQKRAAEAASAQDESSSQPQPSGSGEPSGSGA